MHIDFCSVFVPHWQQSYVAQQNYVTHLADIGQIPHFSTALETAILCRDIAYEKE